jgi:hypothetical protein
LIATVYPSQIGLRAVSGVIQALRAETYRRLSFVVTALPLDFVQVALSRAAWMASQQQNGR